MRNGKLGKVIVNYADPIDLNEYVGKFKDDAYGDTEQLALQLTRDLYYI